MKIFRFKVFPFFFVIT
ncbi:DLP12 prophage; predicted lipoprotein [Escherichia coli K-12]|nr:DLP12 prophage; predicted lipoprotein [Escherichia coli K-12]